MISANFFSWVGTLAAGSPKSIQCVNKAIKGTPRRGVPLKDLFQLWHDKPDLVRPAAAAQNGG